MANNSYIELIQKKALLDALKSVPDEQRDLLIAFASKDKYLVEIKQQLDAIQQQAERNKYSFGTDLLANITGNVITDSAIWILSKLVKIK